MKTAVGKSKKRDVSPDASWSYAFASPTTKTRTAQAKTTDSQSPAPGEPCRQGEQLAASLIVGIGWLSEVVRPLAVLQIFKLCAALQP